jgi:uncharacterized cupin superfamily protein
MSLNEVKPPLAIEAASAPARAKSTNYPEPFASMMANRVKHPLGDLFGLKNFGVNLTRIRPGGVSALHHRHSRQDEFLYVIEGAPTLFTGADEIELRPGMCAGFPAGGAAHHLANRTDADVVILEIGDRTPGDQGVYPNDDVKAVITPNGAWRFTRTDGSSY